MVTREEFEKAVESGWRSVQRYMKHYTVSVWDTKVGELWKCVTAAVQKELPKAHVSLQGSVRRATGVFPVSDLDFIELECKVSSKQREKIAGNVLLALSQLHPDACYKHEVKREVLTFRPTNREEFFGIDIAFKWLDYHLTRGISEEKAKKIRKSRGVRRVIKLLKIMVEVYNLPRTSGSAIEKVVLNVAQQLCTEDVLEVKFPDLAMKTLKAIKKGRPLVEPFDRWTEAEKGDRSFSNRAAHVLSILSRGQGSTRDSPPPAPTTPPRIPTPNRRIACPAVPAPCMPRTHSRHNPMHRPSSLRRDGVSGQQGRGASQEILRPARSSPAARESRDSARSAPQVTGRIPHNAPVTPSVGRVRSPVLQAAGDNRDGRGRRRETSGRNNSTASRGELIYVCNMDVRQACFSRPLPASGTDRRGGSAPDGQWVTIVSFVG